ncbi:DUF2207 domain-containing protein [Thermospira aquatica]|uniref:DUF2207 domain-containing protein n=1 Tax=Thermospira aquatica TaxID=2828656 RepID=A0AAX3BFT8_9SPIR|nr:DUF2207 domain-containing protein [Thermospira aquatica]URA11292.1 DUF2207 domain-containing protein [Thermospira aquatica]
MNKRAIVFCFIFFVFSWVWGEFFEISNYMVRAHILSNGMMDMTEEITVLFYQPRHGIYRTIPTRIQFENFARRFGIRDIRVENFSYDTSWESGLLTIKIGSASRYVEGLQVYTIHYTVVNPILAFTNEGESFQSLYWNLIGTDWDVPIRNATFEVKIDRPWEKAEFVVYAGAYGGTNTSRVFSSYDTSSQTISGKLRGELAPKEGITILAFFPDGFWPINDGRNFFERYVDVLSFGFLIVYTIVLFFLWRKFGKDKPFVKMVHFYPPSELTPAEAGMLIDDKIDQRDVVATFFDWAWRGHIVIEEKKKTFSRDFVFHKKKPLENPHPHEAVLWLGLFSDRREAALPGEVLEKESVALSDLQDVFYTSFERAKGEIDESVKDKQLYKPYSRELSFLCVFLGFGFFIGGVALSAMTEVAPPFVVGALAAVVSFFFASIMPARTPEGQKYYEQLVGFREFIKRAEWPRLERILKDDPLYFDKTLPYAIVFGLEKKWIQKFAPILTTPPSWYVGGGRFSAVYLSDVIHSSISQMGTVMSSSPSRSGGGGFSGGGGGGGGGGSW